MSVREIGRLRLVCRSGCGRSSVAIRVSDVVASSGWWRASSAYRRPSCRWSLPSCSGRPHAVASGIAGGGRAVACSPACRCMAGSTGIRVVGGFIGAGPRHGRCRPRRAGCRCHACRCMAWRTIRRGLVAMVKSSGVGVVWGGLPGGTGVGWVQALVAAGLGVGNRLAPGGQQPVDPSARPAHPVVAE